LLKIDIAVRKAIELEPRLGEAYVALANLERLRLDYTSATIAFDRAVELSPNYAPLYQWYGEFLGLDQGYIQESLPYARMAVALDPRSPIIVRNYGNILLAGGRFDESRVQFDKALEIDPSFAPAYHSKATVFHGAGNVADAVLTMERALELSPESVDYMALLSSGHLELGDVQQSQQWLRRAEEAAAGHQSMAMISLALNTYLGDIEAASKDAEQLLAISPGDFDALRLLREYHLGRSDGSVARELYRQNYPAFFGEESPAVYRGNFYAAVDLAYLLGQTGDEQLAEELLRQASDIVDEILRSRPCCRQLANVKIHAIRGDNESALLALENAIDAGWRANWWLHLEQDPALDNLRDDPRFQALLDRIRADMDAQRKLLAADAE